MSERDRKVLYTIASEDGGWRLTVDRPESEWDATTRPYQFVGPLDMVLRSVDGSARSFDIRNPSVSPMLGGYFVHDRREWKPNLILKVDGREDVERLKQLIAEQKKEIRLKGEMISHLRHVENENIRKIGNIRAHRDRLEQGSVYFCDYCFEEFPTNVECSEHGKVCSASPHLLRQAQLQEEVGRLTVEVSDLKGINARLEDENAHLRDQNASLWNENSNLKDRDIDEDLLDARAKIEQLEEVLAILRGNNASLVRLSDRLNDENERLKTDNARFVVNDARVRQMNLLYEGIRSKDAEAIKSLTGDLQSARKNLEILRAHIIAAGIADQEVLNATASPAS